MGGQDQVMGEEDLTPPMKSVKGKVQAGGYMVGQVLGLE